MSGELKDAVQRLQQIVDESQHIVFFGGAGVSTESGIPDFRSVDGLYSQHYPYPPEQMLSHSFYLAHSDEFYAFYREKILYLEARPNAAHLALARWEQSGKKQVTVITQNIDGLHTAAKSQDVIELHGSIYRNHCRRCGAPYDVHTIKNGSGVPHCECGGIIKPDVVLYEEGLNQTDLTHAVRAISKADALIIGGTSLVVYPAAGLVDYYTGNRLVVINKQPTRQDSRANLLITAPIGEVLGQIEAG